MSLFKTFILPVIIFLLLSPTHIVSTEFSVISTVKSHSLYRTDKVLLYILRLSFFFEAQINHLRKDFGIEKGEKDLEVLINSIKSIQMDFIEVSSNPFFLELLEKYPEFSMVKYLMSSYIIELQCYKKKTKINKLEIQYNAKLINNFKLLFYTIVIHLLI